MPALRRLVTICRELGQREAELDAARQAAQQLCQLADGHPDFQAECVESLIVLGNILYIMGERESGPARLEEALATYQNALQRQERKQAPQRWATTQNNLGAALWKLGERDGNQDRLEAAVEAYKAALEERTRGRVPLDWAATQNNLGNALLGLVVLDGNPERLEAAVEAYQAALEVFDGAKVTHYAGASIDSVRNNLQQLKALIQQRQNQRSKARSKKLKIAAKPLEANEKTGKD